MIARLIESPLNDDLPRCHKENGNESVEESGKELVLMHLQLNVKPTMLKLKKLNKKNK